MANIDSSTLNKNVFMQAFGNAVVADGSVALSAAPLAGDVIRIARINAGTRVVMVVTGNGDLDAHATVPTAAVSLGYAPVDAADGPAAAPAYFGAAGDALLQSVNNGKLYANFAPITFDKDVYLTMTVGVAAATFAAGSIFATAIGDARGVK